MNQFLKLLVLPITLLLILLLFRDRIAPKEVALNTTGITISFYLLQAAERGVPSDTPSSKPPDAKEIQDVARKASTLSLNETTILWVDDNPQNQVYERKALSALGIQFVLAESTTEAIPLLKNQQFDVVITDFKRADDDRGGYTLLDEVKKLPNPPPLIIYSSSASPELEADARKRGAYAETNMPQRLFSLAIQAVTDRK
ncbi:response regulator [Pseudomonas koreensis]|uniref:response regulator n=1 Tax=Pseudomonas koreensis TaxID=198620 RepID=UPI001475D3D8|nr:response regulator [Pseudomonas koreensis]NNA57162.1 response regulator [Pseudomonas koreensis]